VKESGDWRRRPSSPEAGVTGDRNLALQASLVDEMAILLEKAEAMLDELLVNLKHLLLQLN